MRRRAPTVIVALIGAFASVAALSIVDGHAASLNWSSGSLGAGSASVAHCQSSGLGVAQNLSGSNVVSVTVSQIDSACANASVSATVNNGTTSSSGSGTVPAGGGSVTLTLATAVAAKDSEEIDVSINGP